MDNFFFIKWRYIKEKNGCNFFEEGGLDIKSFIFLNEATNSKLCWDIMHSEEYWAMLIRKRVIRGVVSNLSICYYE